MRAVVKQLTDQQLVVAQGQENSARTDLSFIERALFAARLEEGGYDRETIMAALSVDKTGLSRLISSAVKIPRDIIEAIGSAPRAGRDRWIELATRLESATATAAARRLIESDGFAHKDSDERFNAVTNAAAPKPAKAPRPSRMEGRRRHARRSHQGRQAQPDAGDRQEGRRRIRRVPGRAASRNLRGVQAPRGQVNSDQLNKERIKTKKRPPKRLRRKPSLFRLATDRESLPRFAVKCSVRDAP